MTWVRLDDSTPDHPKYASLGDLAPLGLALQVRALCYANRYLTDGHLPTGAMPQLLRGFAPCQPDTGEVIDWPALMVSAGIWETNGGAGYRIHDYADYQPSKAAIEADRTAARARMRALRSPDVRPNNPRTPPDQARSPEVRDPRPGPGPSRTDKDSRRSREQQPNSTGPVSIREVIDGRRAHLEVTQDPDTSPSATPQPGPDVPW
jgi:hypothetical protein